MRSATSRRVLLAGFGIAIASGCAPPRPLDPIAARPSKGSTGPVRDPVCPAGRTRVWRGRFDRAGWLASWDPRARFDYGEENTSLVADDRFGQALRVRYPRGSSSSAYAREGHPLGGAEFKIALPDGTSSSGGSIFLSYALRFDPEFPWVRGGKLPGVCGGACPSGGAVVTGTGGWSFRFMWRPNGAGEEYAYILPARDYGTELGLGTWSFQGGGWHRLAEELIPNDGDQANGVARVWYDADPAGKPTFEATGLTFRRDATGATTLFFSTFFGGHDASWATPIDTYADFADFVVCR